MPSNDPRAILQDPDFYKLSPDDQRQLMTGADAQFGQLSQGDQMQILSAAAQQHGHLAPALSPEQQSTLGEVNSGLGAVGDITNAFRHAVMPAVDAVRSVITPPPPDAFPKDFPNFFPNSIPFVQNLALGISRNLEKAKTQFQGGNPAGGLAYGAAAAFPPAGAITNLGEELRGANPETGLVPPNAHPDYSGAIGDVLGLVAPMALTEGAGALTGKFKVGVGNHLTPEMQQAAEYLRQNNVPLSIGQATGSRAAQGLQALGEHIPGAAGVLDDFRDLQQNRINQLAKDQVGGRSPGFYGAGSSTQQALNNRIQNLHTNADQAYNQWRALNAGNKQTVPVGSVPLEQHDPAAFRQRLGGQNIPIQDVFNALDSATSSHAVPTPSGHLAIMTNHDANAIKSAAQVKQQLLGLMQPGSGTSIPAQTLYDAISSPGMSRGAFANIGNAIRGVLEQRFPQTFSEQVPIMEEMSAPADMRNLKAAIKPIADEYEKTLPYTQGQVSPGYAVLKQILDRPDFVPADIADRDLGSLKRISRQFTGLKSGPAKFAIPELSKSIEDITAQTGPQALQALKNGRAAVSAEHDVRDLLDRLPSEPAQLVKRLSQGDDTAVNDLTLIRQHAPMEIPKIAQTVLEDMIQNATSEGGYRKAAQTQNMWNNLGPQTKEMLFGAQKAKDLDNLFRGAKLLGGDANPSGTAKVGALGSTAVKMFVSPLEGAVRLMGAKKLAEILTSPKSVDQVLGGKGIGVGKLPTGRTPARIATYMRLLHPDETDQQQQPQQ